MTITAIQCSASRCTRGTLLVTVSCRQCSTHDRCRCSETSSTQTTLHRSPGSDLIPCMLTDDSSCLQTILIYDGMEVQVSSLSFVRQYAIALTCNVQALADCIAAAFLEAGEVAKRQVRRRTDSTGCTPPVCIVKGQAFTRAGDRASLPHRIGIPMGSLSCMTCLRHAVMELCPGRTRPPRNRGAVRGSQRDSPSGMYSPGAQCRC